MYDVFVNVRNMCLKIYELDPTIYFSSWISMASTFKKTKVKLDILADIDLLLMVEKGIRGEISHSVSQYAKANNKYMKNYDKNKESSYLQYWDVKNLYGRAMSQKLPINTFEWIKDTSQFNEDLKKNYNEKSDAGDFLKIDVILKNYMNLKTIYHF